MIHTSAPATLMLMGEHAVLRNYPCLVAAASPRLHVYLTPRNDNIITIKSALGEHQCSLDHIEIKPPFTFVLSVIKNILLDFAGRSPDDAIYGFNLEIVSEFEANLGLGSSAATLIATTAALFCHSRAGGNPLGSTSEINITELFETAKKNLHEVQGQGSGADLAAALLGGIIYYKIKPLTMEKLPCEIPLTAIYSGSKLSTSEVITIINNYEQKDPEFKKHFQEIGKAVELAKTALLQNDMAALADAFILNQNIMQQMHLVNANIEHILQRLDNDSGILAAKISGSGLGDCVIGLGQLNDARFPQGEFEERQGIKSIELNLSPLGLIIHD